MNINTSIQTVIFKIVLALFFLQLNNSLFSQDKALVQTKESQQNLSPSDVLTILKEGNLRFTQNKMLSRNFSEQVKASAKGQYPYAVILACIDSRVVPEISFDQGIGDIFDARIAGNFINEDILGSLEFACKISGAKLILVMGHSNCGAIKGAIDNAQLGNLTQLLTKIEPAIVHTTYTGDKSSKNYEYVDLVAKENVLLAIEDIKLRSQVLKEMFEEGKIDIKGCMYDLETGMIEFY